MPDTLTLSRLAVRQSQRRTTPPPGRSRRGRPMSDGTRTMLSGHIEALCDVREAAVALQEALDAHDYHRAAWAHACLLRAVPGLADACARLRRHLSRQGKGSGCAGAAS